jgi:glycosyltransferase involved in cell wall biosynthesis
MKGEVQKMNDIPPPLRVYVVEFLGRGGLIHYAYQLCSALSVQGVEVELITDSNYELETRSHNFQVRKLWNLWDPRPVSQQNKDIRTTPSTTKRLIRRGVRGLAYYAAWIALIRYGRKNRPDIVQFGEIRFAADLVPLRILRSMGIVLVDICHNVVPFDTSAETTDLLRDSPRSRSIFRKIYATFELIFVHSEINRVDFNRIYGRSKVVVIPHGNEDLFTDQVDDLTGSSDSLRRRLCIADDAPVALFFGTLTKYKGIDVLIEAFEKVVRSLPDAKLVIAGFPNPDVDVEKLKKSINDKGLRDAVRLCLEYIPLPEVKAFFDVSGLVALPYKMIFQSGALQIAYSSGKPVVATSVGGLIEAVEDGSTGFLVPVGDSNAFANAMIRLLSDHELARKMGGRALELSKTVYGWENIARTVKRAYMEVCPVPVDK